MATFLLIRHAETDTVGKSIAGWLPDVHLNETGGKQAELLAQRLAGVPLQAIYSSPLERALETAQPLARRRNLRIQPCEAAGEIRFGEWTGLPISELEPLPEWRRFNKLRSLSRVPGGELMLETQTRIVSEMECMRRRHRGRTVAIISHGDVIKAALAHLAGVHLDLFHRIEISPASVTVVSLNEQGPRILRVNDTGELAAADYWSQGPV